MRSRCIILAGTIIGTIFGGTISITGAQEAPTSAQDSGGLQEVIITAEKRSENLEKTPIAVSAVSGAELQEQAKNTVEDIFSVIPDVRFETNAEAGTALFIRGVGPALQTDPDASLFVDGVYQATTSGTGFDLARVEVLRGPQGTLYGRNAAAGAANIITNDPTDQFDASASIQVGNYHALRTEAVVNSPVSPNVDLRASFLEERHSGYLSNGSNDEDTQAARFKVLVKPSNEVSLLLTAAYVHLGGEGLADTYPPQAAAPVQYCWCSNPADQSGGRQDSYKVDVYGRLEWDLGWSKLTYQPAWYRWNAYRTVDDLGFLSQQNTGSTQTTQNSQELRLASPSDSRLTWVAGLYYLKYAATADPFAIPLASGIAGTFAPLPYFTNTYNSATSYAGFGQVTLPITDKFRVTGGVRYTDDKKSTTESVYSQVPNYNTPPTVPAVLDSAVPAVTSNNSWKKTTWLARLEYDLAPQSLLYASVSTGYKAGGQNPSQANGARTAVVIVPPYAPESLTAYEAGIKNRFFDNRLQFNADAYYYQYKDIQEFIIGPGPNNGPPSAVVVNATSATLYGVETDAIWSVTPHDQLTALVDYESTKFGVFNYPSIFYGTPPTFNIVRTGQSLPDAPKWTTSLGYQHVFELPDSSKLTFGGQFRYYTSYNVTIEPAYNAFQRSFHVSDAHLTYASPNGKWDTTAYVNNIENTAQILFAQNVPLPLPGGPIYRNAIAPPRTFGVSIGMHY